ncbi:uncharacterized protein LOC110981992 [Acanthaster planci]|uniref:Uncharacterized protein LOC110981992 n=1 Tax=Acanthaster planci TaxID=133434 RepID=A0A8B7YR75_ACAPL|nr:uncharacterized protein LOC110981992 [Acanthaster planci]XP_022095785.1 uncharacterized protein LOC110981992 [Acanthaster planci]XP_022095787.1 uncharacterized protein LOC110981992 [Acanthaster planci]
MHFYLSVKNNSRSSLCKLSMLLQVCVMLCLSGDVYPNRGPGCTYPCGICNKAVNLARICCDHCNIWMHRECIPMSEDMYRILADHSSLSWTCLSCGIPNFSSSLFWQSSSSSFFDKNLFSILSDCNAVHDIILSLSNTSLTRSSGKFSRPKAASSPLPKSASKLPKQTASKINTNMRVVITNCNVVLGKKEAFAETVKDSNPHIILVTKSWLKPGINDNECIPDNYRIFRKDREGKMGGSVVIAVRKDLIPTHLEFLDVEAEMIYGFLSRWLTPSQFTSAVFTAHLTKDLILSKNSEIHWEKLDLKKNPTVSIGGDFNVPDVNWEVLC